MENEDTADECFTRALEGDSGAFESLLRSHEAELRGLIQIGPLWRRSLEVDDILQVSYLEAFLRIGTLRDRSRAGYRAWMRQLVENNLRDAIRALERDKRPDARRRQTQGPEGESARTLLQRLSNDDETVSAPASAEERAEALRAAMRRLPKSYRTAIELFDLQELSADEVALQMERSRGAVHLLRSRGHDRLRELLSG